MDSKTIFEDYQEYLINKKLSRSSLKSRLWIIIKLYQFLEEKCISIDEINSFIIMEFLSDLSYLKNSSYNTYLFFIKDFIIYLENLGIIASISLLLKNKPLEDKLPSNLPVHVLHQLCTPHPSEKLQTLLKLRNHALIEFLVSTGVRVEECCNACIKDLSADFSECFIHTIKNGNDRLVYLGEPAQLSLKNYFEKRKVCIEKDGATAIFAMRGGHMSPEALRKVVVKLSNLRLGYAVKPHSLRHSFATEMLRGTGCLPSIQEMLGHKHMNNTSIYCHLDFKDAMQAVQKYHPFGEDFVVEDFEEE